MRGGGVKHMKPIFAAVIGCAVLAGCQEKEDLISFDGHFYRSNLAKGEARHLFTVSSRPVSASLTGALQAAEYEAFDYCINQYGTSDIDWVVGPDLAPESYAIVDDTVTLQGGCKQ